MCPWALMCRGSKCSRSLATRKETCEIPPKEKDSTCGRFLSEGAANGDAAPAHRDEGGWESSCTPSALTCPGGTDPASQAQSFVPLSPGLQKSICVFLKVRRHQIYSVRCNTNTGSASVWGNQFKALKAANYVMEDLKNPRKHCSSCLKCPHAGIRMRNSCFNLQYMQGALPSNQFHLIKKYKNISSLPGELN